MTQHSWQRIAVVTAVILALVLLIPPLASRYEEQEREKIQHQQQ
jgi:hypothetical protein